jgi:hypothetical protein
MNPRIRLCGECSRLAPPRSSRHHLSDPSGCLAEHCFMHRPGDTGPRATCRGGHGTTFMVPGTGLAAVPGQGWVETAARINRRSSQSSARPARSPTRRILASHQAGRRRRARRETNPAGAGHSAPHRPVASPVTARLSTGHRRLRGGMPSSSSVMARASRRRSGFADQTPGTTTQASMASALNRGMRATHG